LREVIVPAFASHFWIRIRSAEDRVEKPCLGLPGAVI
jgi:hypothetical protein